MLQQLRSPPLPDCDLSLETASIQIFIYILFEAICINFSILLQTKRNRYWNEKNYIIWIITNSSTEQI